MNEDFRKSPPEALSAVPFNIPQTVAFELENGLKAVVIEDRRFPTINIRVGFRFGDIDDPNDGTGVNSAMSSMLTEGTEHYSSRELAEKIDSLGGSLSVGSGFDNTVLRASMLSPHFSKMVGLMSEVLLRPTFPKKELELYKQNAIEGLKYQRSQPDFLADEMVAATVYGDHPYGTNSPSESQFGALKQDQLVDSWRRGLVPNNALVVAVGDVSADELRAKLEEHFAGWKKGKEPEREFADIPVYERRLMKIVDRPGSTQANIVLSNIAIERTSPDYFDFLLMNQVLGAGASSRLFMNLREEKGYTYGAYSRIYARRHAGAFEATSEVRSAVTGESLKEFFFELNRIRDDVVGEDELNDAKNFLAGVFPIRAETQGGLIGLVVSQLLQGLPEDYLETYRDRVRAVTAEDVQRVARKYIHPEKVSVVIVGDAEDILDQVKSFADEISVYDAFGNEKDFSGDQDANVSEPVDISGEWSVLVDAQGQELPVTIQFKQTGTEITGKMQSMLGDGAIESGVVTGAKFSATVLSDFQGQELALRMKGSKEGDSITGTLTVPMMPEPLSFTGTKK
ncbi:MAG: insulinase family protein [Pyrinomonadaceae bacterium]|nr:insulinase family protein [Pyrinomonadaceae bacterium]